MNRGGNDSPYILSGHKVTMQFGGLVALRQVDFAVARYGIMGLIGPNGAGKTTLFNCITGNHRPTSGEIRFQEIGIGSLPPYRITRLGIARTFQNIRLFKEMSVLDNVLVGMHIQIKQGISDVLFKTKRFSEDEQNKAEKADQLLEISGLIDARSELAKNLPYGAQRRLEIARALATEPALLLLDEPTAGMNLNETDALIDFIHLIKDRFNLTILLIEHDMKFVMGLCEKIMVLDHGQKIAEGPPGEIQDNEAVIEAYLGRGMARAEA